MWSNFIENFDTSTSESEIGRKFLENLEKTGIIIEDIFYHDPSVGHRVSVKSNPKLALDAKLQTLTNPEEQSRAGRRARSCHLDSIVFRTTKPLVINVDAGKDGLEKCRKIVGGPYRVIVSSAPNIKVQLLQTNACFGLLEQNFWIHPHTPTQTLSTYSNGSGYTDEQRWKYFKDCILNAEGNACLGEASPPLWDAFVCNDPKRVLFAAMTWLTNANSTDAWGKHFKYFPKLQDVRLDGQLVDKDTETTETVEELISSEEGMEAIAEQMLTNLEEPDNITERFAEVAERVAETWRELPDDEADEADDIATATLIAALTDEDQFELINPVAEGRGLPPLVEALEQVLRTEVAPEEQEPNPGIEEANVGIVADAWQNARDRADQIEEDEAVLFPPDQALDPTVDTSELRETNDFGEDCTCETCHEYRMRVGLPAHPSYEYDEDHDQEPPTRRLRHAGYSGYRPYSPPPTT